VTTGAEKAGKAGKSAGFFLIGLEKQEKPLLCSDRKPGKAGISTFEILLFFNCFLEWFEKKFLYFVILFY